jgi:hypothetical protein
LNQLASHQAKQDKAAALGRRLAAWADYNIARKRGTMLLTGVIIFLVSVVGFTAADPLAPPKLPIGWERIHIPDVGTIDIPPTMEVQGSTLTELSKEYTKELIPQSDSSESGRVTIQQKGLNDLDPEAAKFYVRIMVVTNIGNRGDFETLNSRYGVTKDELREISILFRTQVENQFMRILQWDAPSVELINGMQAMRLSYRRQMKDNPPVRVATYIFQNYDRMHQLTMSYRESERNRWLSDFPTILSSFRITNIRGPTVSADTPMELPFADNWILNLILSAILTWAIGLFPPLLTRFAILKRPMSKISAILFVVIFWFINITVFISLGSQSKTHSALFFVAIASYYVLRSGSRKYQTYVQAQRVSETPSAGEGQEHSEKTSEPDRGEDSR